MKVIDAIWEERNLGVTTQECTIDLGDSVEEVEKCVDSLNSQYQVVKAPNGRVDIFQLLMQKRFSFVESVIKVSYKISNAEIASQQPLIERLRNQVTYEVMTESDVDYMCSQIQKGMFKTDRVFLDPYFKKETAGKRYALWMKDEYKRGSLFYSYKYKNESIGFICAKTDGKVFNALLGGVYDTNKPLPFGGVIHLKQLEIAKELGMESFVTHISSNNVPVVRTYVINGYSFDDINYVFVKHCERIYDGEN